MAYNSLLTTQPQTTRFAGNMLIDKDLIVAALK
jgi:hypothetical protein